MYVLVQISTLKTESSKMIMIVKMTTVLLVVACAVFKADGGAVLVTFPVPGRSHSILGNSIVNILLDAGHEVTYVTPFPLETNNTRLTNVDISSLIQDATAPEHLNIENLSANLKQNHWILHLGNLFATRALRHPAVQVLLNDPNTAFDVIIAEWFYSGFLAPLAAVYDCPLIWYTSGDVSWQSLRVIHEPSSPAYSVDPQSLRAPAVPFTIGEKTHQLMLRMYLSGWMCYFKVYVETPAYREIFTSPLLLRGRPLPDYEALVYNASLMLINSHPPLGQNVPLPRNVKYVGGHHLRFTPNPLPKDLKEILDESTKGVIYFSMGSNLKGKDIPRNMIYELIEMFGRLEQTVLWKLEEQPEEVPNNVHILEWAPQESIINHPNIRLFITHGGLLSITEATHHGVPIIGIPIFGDQYVNVDLVVHRGCGIRVDFTNNLPSDIWKGVNEILGNSSYQRNAKDASSIFRRRLTSPQKELLHWVQLVAETRGASFLRSPALDVSMIEKLNLDILLLIIMLLWFLSKVVKVIRVHFKDDDEAILVKRMTNL